ncbi:MAG: anaerobic ribonucleoside-triphosphate reductase activating protein [Eubacteriales bacterium]|nr:anaerobic ribonucleoside-triphosphate reductase activating protein [Eubacteriales bacterium]MDD3883020.1 anaerobic ribonucleoside-triphosphate reductase activating protein [Eubacteriales bacterium]MDD4513653.1 anaerobic ribonucleoside-triphosphate reductase activating protein [Eubacteriales bacterium]
MHIQGLQKLTLLDYPEKTAATVFTCGCNFRCPFCHNSDLLSAPDAADDLPVSEILAFLKKRKNVLDGVCVSGGEPLMQSDIAEFLSSVKELGYLVKLDTNGSYPEKLKALCESGLVDYVAMDIKNSREKYALTAGIENLDIGKIEESASYIMENLAEYEFRTTCVSGMHTAEDIRGIGKWLGKAKRYFLQGFVDSGRVLRGGLKPLEKPEMEELLNAAREYILSAELRGIK